MGIGGKALVEENTVKEEPPLLGLYPNLSATAERREARSFKGLDLVVPPLALIGFLIVFPTYYWQHLALLHPPILIRGLLAHFKTTSHHHP